MKTLASLLIPVVFTFGLMAADDDKGELKMTGCLNKDNAGAYILTSENGQMIPVVGPADLEKHSANHTVTLRGKQKVENGKLTFFADRVEHVADKCSVSTNR